MFLVVLTLDVGIPSPYPEEMRNALMLLFLRDISQRGITEIVPHALSKVELHSRRHRICDSWEGVQCKDQEVKEVRYHAKDFGNFDIHALPNSVTLLWITTCQQKFQLHTRMLPRNLVMLSLSVNKIYGRLDLTNLPMNLELAFLWSNRMKGPVDLTKLPRPLRQLDISQNNIKQKILWYDNLPDNVESISVVKPWYNQNGIKEVRAVDPERTADVTIFEGMAPKNIH